MRTLWLWSAASLSASMLSGAAMAQTAFASDEPTAASPRSTNEPGGVEEVVVTAQRREENLQNVPIAVTAVSGEKLTALGVRNVSDLSTTTPSLVVRVSDPTSVPQIFIRGVGSSDFNVTSSSPVTVYADGVYINSQAGQIGAYTDLARVEVLRGPQGTLYGRNTTGGAINVISARPTWEPDGYFQLDVGTFNQVNATGAVSGAVLPGLLAVRASGSYLYRDGYAINELNGQRLRGLRKADGRLSFLFTPAPDLEVLAHVAWSEADSTLAYKPVGLIPRIPAAAGANGLCTAAYYNTPACTDILGYVDTDPNPDHGRYYAATPVSSRDFRADMTATWTLGKVALVSVTGYDFGRTSQAATDVTAGPDQLLTATYFARDRSVSQELRLQSDGGGPLKWVIGGYYLNVQSSAAQSFDVLRVLRPLFTTPANPTGLSVADNVALYSYPVSQKLDSYAAFGQLDYALTDKLTLTGGLRYSRDDKRFDYRLLLENVVPVFGSNQSRSFGDWSWRAGVEYKLAPAAMVYATYNRGFRSGGFFGGFATDPAQLQPYRNETVNAYEAGTKLTLLDRKVRFNLSGFFYDYRDLQVFSIQPRGNLTIQVLTNAANARMYGGEAELTIAPLKGLQIVNTISLLHSEYLDFQSAGVDLSGNRLTNAPAFTYSGGIVYNHDFSAHLGIEATLNGSYRSSTFFTTDNNPALRQKGFWLAGGRVGLTTGEGRLNFGIWAQNLFDKRYATNVTPLETFGVYSFAPNDPRTIGGYIRTRF